MRTGLLGLFLASTPAFAQAEAADDCSTWAGVALPLEGGTIGACHPSKVVIGHRKDARPIRWDYVEHFRGHGWTRGAPAGGDPVVQKDGQTIRFKAKKKAVILELEAP